ncbi:xanthine dehydrogenase accessory protein XdhC [Nereida sp. MMG025]|uniref:xanthine dehydrogenase accessory protein XdhC n=1 Tax=Nereida sp. MMG025 TaxID=2909981 RepID=UPI001F01F368|nr:xanthine dehydrogenase accessory protein XdhC [Nereida sp. MMG025]MCF6444139.1 xanthine dehydrogenase accessory protein XdhC [Nereida sp. MMG025]
MSDWITVTITQVRGSSPRDAGTSMRVFADCQLGTIGGGALEWEATHLARAMLKDGQTQQSRRISLGPDIGQCCGGQVTLEFSANTQPQTTQKRPLWIWGAGHTGRAIAQVMAPFEDREIALIDVAADRFPTDLPMTVSQVVATNPLDLVKHANPLADHIILTYSHDLDLALCDGLLRHGFTSCGLIGSATKWARFRKRLAQMGHAHDEIDAITCPIGDPSLGKHPQAIALGVAAAMLRTTSAPIPKVKTA